MTMRNFPSNRLRLRLRLRRRLLDLTSREISIFSRSSLSSSSSFASTRVIFTLPSIRKNKKSIWNDLQDQRTYVSSLRPFPIAFPSALPSNLSSIDTLSLEDVRSIAKNSVIPLSIQQMMSFYNSSLSLRLKAAKFLYKEYSTRFARAITKLIDLPLDLPKEQSIAEVTQTYMVLLQVLQSMKVPETEIEEMRFTNFLVHCATVTSNTVPAICRGLHEIQEKDLWLNAMKMEHIQRDISAQLDNFFTFRLGLRLLAWHHLQSRMNPRGKFEFCDVERIAHEAAKNASDLCRKYYGNNIPSVNITLCNKIKRPFMYVPRHIHHMIFELVKNSMRATIEQHQTTKETCQSLNSENKLTTLCPTMNVESAGLDFCIPNDISVGVHIYPSSIQFKKLPSIDIIISQGNEDLTIKVSDKAGGICRSNWDKLWYYMYTTSPFPYTETLPKGQSLLNHFCGGGFGLPVSRIVARYFGGDLHIIPMEGYGTDAYIQVPRLASIPEALPYDPE